MIKYLCPECRRVTEALPGSEVVCLGWPDKHRAVVIKQVTTAKARVEDPYRELRAILREVRV